MCKPIETERRLLLAFADHLNSYAGLEEMRFDFMVIDFLQTHNQKLKETRNVCENGT
jgi:hypothetical protein